MPDIIYNTLKDIQSEYLSLLKKIEINIGKSWKSAIDEINMFWLQRKKVVLFAMEKYFMPYNTFLFTGATFLDYAKNEHFPFIICNGTHIIDDNLCTYGNIVDKIDDQTYNNTIKQQFEYAIKDNINILENCAERLLILPIRYLDEDVCETINVGAESVFFSLFTAKFDTLSEYFKNIKTIKDLENNLKPGIEKSLLFFQKDNVNDTLSNRLQNYIVDAGKTMTLKGKSMGYIFFSAVYSHLSAALHIMMISVKYQIIPYLRYNVVFHTFYNLLQNYPDVTQRNLIENKVCTCYLIYKSFDFTSIPPSKFNDFAVKVQERRIFEKVYNKICNRKEGSIKSIGDFSHDMIKSVVFDCKK